MFRDLVATPSGRVVVAALGVLVAGVVFGLAALWPDATTRFASPLAGTADRAVVQRVVRQQCPKAQREPCQMLTIRLLTGAAAGRTTTLTLPGLDAAPEVEHGDTLRVIANDVVGGGAGLEAPPGVEAYSFSDFERRSPLYLLAAIFAVLVVALARWKGVRSLLGLLASLAIVTQFMVPAILQGSSPVLAALVGALAVMLVTIALAHGTGVTSIAAILGSAVSLLATGLLAAVFVELGHITGFSSEESALLQGSSGGRLSLQGLVLAGIVVGALGVLDDVTVSQASTVMAIKRANPAQGLRRLTASALSVGRDHLSATVNTLVLAYVGAALPILLIFEDQGTSFGDALNREAVGGQVVAMLVGSIGLILAVPLTTGLAAWLAQRLPAAALDDAAAAHQHD